MRRASWILPLIVGLVPIYPATGQEISRAVAPNSYAPAEDIVVQGTPPRCRPRPGDPQDAVDMGGASTGSRRQQTIAIDPATGRYALRSDDFAIGGPEIWQRAGIHLDQFVFRVPTNGDPICIGARERWGAGTAQLRRAISARPFWGKYMVFSTYVAARSAGRVDIWIAAGANDPRPRADRDIGRDIVAGGFKQVPITGNYRWRQVNFLVGPIPCMAAEISYGVQLKDGGDVWLAKPQFVEVPEDKLSLSMKRAAHGEAMLRTDPICRHYLKGEPLFARRGDALVPLAPDADLYPGLVLLRQTDEREYVSVPYHQSFAFGLVEF